MNGKRAYYQASISNFLLESPDSIIGTITQAHSQALEHLQTGAWKAQIALLKAALNPVFDGHILFELQIPRMGRRADVALVLAGIILFWNSKLVQKVTLPRTYDKPIAMHWTYTTFTREVTIKPSFRF